MTTFLLLNMPIFPSKSIKSSSTSNIAHLSQCSINDEDSKHKSKIQTNEKSSSDSSTTSTDQSSSEITDTESSPERSIYHRRSPTEIQVKIENNEAEFFACSLPKKSRRKRDRIRAAFRRKFDRSESTASETSIVDWNDMLAKTFTSIQNDIEQIIDSFDQIDQLSLTEQTSSNTSEIDQIQPELSFYERQYEKLKLMQLSEMLHQPECLTCEMKEYSYPYTDIIEPHNFKYLRVTTGMPDEHLLIQCRPIQHRKCRYRTQRSLLRIKTELRKFRRDVRGENPNKISQRISSLDVVNYRHRLEKTLLEFRRQMIEYNQLNHQTQTSTTTTQNNDDYSKIKIQIDNYRMKSKTLNWIIPSTTNELISTPYIPPYTRHHKNLLINKNKHDQLIDNRFDPTNFVNLNEKAEEFFGKDLPFWNLSLQKRLSNVLLIDQDKSIHSTKTLWNSFVLPYKSKQKLVHRVQLNQHRYSTDDSSYQSLTNDEIYFDCSSLRKSHSFNDFESVDF